MTTEVRDLTVWDDSYDFDMGGDSRESDAPDEYASFNGKYGAFVNSKSPDDVDTKRIDAVILRYALPPRNWGTRDDAGTYDVICESRDSIVPVAETYHKAIAAGFDVGPSCATCPHGDAMWSKNKETGRWDGKPDCRKQISLLLCPLISEPDEEPAILQLRIGGTSVKPVKDAIAGIDKDRKRTRPAVPPFGYHVRLSSERQVNKERGFDYWLVKVEVVGQVDRELWPAYAAAYHRMTSRIERFKAQSEAAAAAAEATIAPPSVGPNAPDPVAGDDLPWDSGVAVPAEPAPWKGAASAPIDAQAPMFDDQGNELQAPRVDPADARRKADPRNKPAPTMGASGWEERPATEPQIKAIYAIARGTQAMDDGTIEEWVKSRWGCTPGELSRRQASEAIDALKLGVAS